MHLYAYFTSFLGMYMTQSCIHSLIAALIADRAISSWGITNPLTRQRFRIAIIFIALFSFPLYQLINPERGSLVFRLDTLFDSSRWLNLVIWGRLTLGLPFILLLSATSLLFLIQEIIPVARHAAGSRQLSPDWDRLDEQSEIMRGLRRLQGEPPDFYITESKEHILFTRTGKKPSIYFSTGLIDDLTVEQLEAAIAHEIAHIKRNKRPLLIAVFFLRIVLFFNPVVLLEFRRIVHEEEAICDDMAVESTGNPHALAESLEKLYYKLDDEGSSLVRRGHISHLRDRITRIESRRLLGQSGQSGKLAFIVIIIVALNYFVV